MGYAVVAMPWVLAVAVPLGAMVALLIGRRTAVYWVGAYFALLLYFPNNSYGLLEPLQTQNFYNRATGTFYFSAINVMLFGLALQAFVARRMALPLPVAHNLRAPAFIFLAVFAGNILVAQFLPHVHWTRLIGPVGLLHVFNFMLAFYALTAAMREPRDFDRLIQLILFCAVTRGLWGLLRFAVLGGDPANFYANMQRLDVRLSFFDINDSLVAALALFIAAWRLLCGQCTSMGSRLLHLGIVALELFIIAFSYRRTAWGGLLLVLVLLAFCRPARQRWWLLTVTLFTAFPLLAYKLAQRAGTHAQGGSWLETALPDVIRDGQVSFTTGRFAELYAAWLSVKDSPLWGLGTWGSYDGSRFSELAWHRGEFGWMHSGMLHIMLKSGLIGVAAVLLAVVALLRFVLRERHALDEPQRGLLYLGIAGLLFMLPNWLIGTPLIEFRTMQMMALCTALPYLAVVAARGTATAAASVRRAPWVFGIRPLRMQSALLQPHHRV